MWAELWLRELEQGKMTGDIEDLLTSLLSQHSKPHTGPRQNISRRPLKKHQCLLATNCPADLWLYSPPFGLVPCLSLLAKFSSLASGLSQWCRLWLLHLPMLYNKPSQVPCLLPGISWPNSHQPSGMVSFIQTQNGCVCKKWAVFRSQHQNPESGLM